ncbi:MAG: MmgE/PrpD family protein [Gemmatales bacterium]|nr:MmgE/PrpD family protein [Gemmatales bacterium]MDW8176173.1 MmgE/PrpD family protein [Gemmatales bacterium]
MSEDMYLAERFAHYANRLRYEQLPAAVVHEVKRRFIDSFATALGAWQASAHQIARRCALRVQSVPGCTLLGGGKTSAEWATFVNGLLVRYLDFNDTYLSLEPAHPSDNLSAIWAVGEWTGASGRDLITAAVLAYEIQCRLCDAASLRKHGFDHVVYGAISSCLAACKLLHLDEKRTTHALGIAGVCNVALRQTRAGELSMWKGCAFANAARNGVFAAFLAAEGMTGPAPIFEGELGFMKLLTGPFAVAPLAAETGPADAGDFMIGRTHIKYWPVEYHAQSAVEAALQLRPQITSLEDIARIDVYTFDAAVDIIAKDPEKWRPRTRETADHSLPYCVAVALYDGAVTLDSFDERHLHDERLLKLVAKIQVHRDATLSARYPQGIPNRVVITLHNGTALTAEVEFPRGHARNPVSDAELEQKFRCLVSPIFGAQRTESLLSGLWQLEEITHTQSLMEMFVLNREDS